MKLAVPTADGIFTAHYSEGGLAQLDFPGDKRSNSADAVPVAEAIAWHATTIKALNELLSGRAPHTLPPLDLSCGSEFQQQVWQALLRIDFGRTKTYAEVAEDIGNLQATRAVGAACGANPIPVLVPCHRVLAAKGKLGGYSGSAGWKEKLLAREGSQLI